MTHDEGSVREAHFKARLKNYFPGRRRIKLAYTTLGGDESCFGYSTQEYVLLGKKSSSFGWVPHIRNLTDDDLIDVLIEDLKKDLTTKQK